jgi:hypothetical protein
MASDIEIYVGYIAEVRPKLDVIQDFIDGRATTGVEAYNNEFVFLQLRKTLELIAFASLTANKDVYSAVHEKFSEHWRAKAMLDELQKVNPDFYPDPYDPPQETAPGVKHFPKPSDSYMTKSDFVILYNAASAFLHVRNPFTAKASPIDILYPVQEWVVRIRRLLLWHVMHLVSGDKWVVNVPLTGAVQAWPAAPQQGN